MLGAKIDIYHDEIAAAIASGNDMAVAEIARSFCERCHYWRPWRIVSVKPRAFPHDGLVIDISVEFIGEQTKAATVSVGYINGKRRLAVDGEDVACDSSADVVHLLETPCAFFDGIYYAFECLSEDARNDLALQIAKWDQEAREHEERARNEASYLHFVQKRLDKTKRQLNKAEARLDRTLSQISLIGSSRTWTIHPIDFGSRLVSAQSMIDAPHPEFITLSQAKGLLSGKPGVYFGWRVPDGKCVYVGKGKDLGKRLHAGREELKDCKITYLEMPEDQIHTWELFFIWLHKPERNIEVRLSEAALERPELARIDCVKS